MKNLLLLLLLASTSFVGFCQKYHKVAEVPNPKLAGQDYFVSNPDGVLTDVAAINTALVELERQTKVEFAVVVVDNFDEDQEDFDFAKELFEKWGIGKAGADNGLLLFIAVDRRQYRFISGYGLEGLLPDLILKRVGEKHLVPAFKANNYDDGILAATNDLLDQLTDPKHQAEIQSLIKASKKKKATSNFTFLFSVAAILLTIGAYWLINKQLPKLNKKAKGNLNGYNKAVSNGCVLLFFALTALPFLAIFIFGFKKVTDIGAAGFILIIYIFISIVLFFKHLSALGALRNFHNDDQNFFETARQFNLKNSWLILFSPFILITLLVQELKRNKTENRFTPPKDSKGRDMVKVNRDMNLTGHPFLNEGQQAEEKAQVYDYDIWESEDKKEHLVKQWPAETFEDFIQCPKCGIKTFSKPKLITEERATYTATGTAREVRECSFCNHKELIRMVTLAKLVKSSSSSSSSSGNSSSSSSSSSGSFGGGSSGGGGAGGSW